MVQSLDIENFTTSSKLEALVDDLKAKKGANNKSIVFAQYTSFLDIIEWRLAREGFRVVKFVGSMPIVMRQSILKAFRSEPQVEVILISLKAGGEGLNLQIASQVYVMEPWWNPAVEMQAVQRAHRIGTTHAVRAIRFITTDSIEERMMALQDKKRLVFDGTVDGKLANLSKLSGEDLKYLFKN